jgi:hypothetical protein
MIQSGHKIKLSQYVNSFFFFVGFDFGFGFCFGFGFGFWLGLVLVLVSASVSVSVLALVLVVVWFQFWGSVLVSALDLVFVLDSLLVLEYVYSILPRLSVTQSHVAVCVKRYLTRAI